MDVLGHDSYLVKVDGSNRLTKRNRQFLRRIQPYMCDSDDLDSHTPTYPTCMTSDASRDLVYPLPTNATECHRNVTETGKADGSPFMKVSASPHSQWISDTSLPAPIQHEVDPNNTPEPFVSSSEAPAQGSHDQPLCDQPMVPSTARDLSNSLPYHHRPRINERWIVNPKFAQPKGCSSSE